MEKRGSRYLRYAIYNATKYVCLWNPTFAAYLDKKRAEGKHYNVALSCCEEISAAYLCHGEVSAAVSHLRIRGLIHTNRRPNRRLISYHFLNRLSFCPNPHLGLTFNS